MKRAQFVPGFPELRGNVSGAQKLQYPTDNLGAYEGPMGSVNYARNYRPSVVVSMRARDGRFHYSIRTKTSNHLTAKSKKAMALLGATGAIYAAILKVPSLLAGIQAQYAALTEIGMQKSFRKYVTDVIRNGLIEHRDLFTFAGPASLVQVDNPWVKFSGVLNISISQAILVKFWTELVTNGITFTVDGLVGIAQTGDDFGTDIVDTNKNILGLTRKEGASGVDQYIALNDMFLLDAAEAYVPDSAVVAAAAYTTTDVEPE